MLEAELFMTPVIYLKVQGHLGSSVGVQLLISAQVMVSRFVRSSPASGSMLTAWSLLGILSVPLSLCPSLARIFLFLSQNKQT